MPNCLGGEELGQQTSQQLWPIATSAETAGPRPGAGADLLDEAKSLGRAIGEAAHGDLRRLVGGYVLGMYVPSPPVERMTEDIAQAEATVAKVRQDVAADRRAWRATRWYKHALYERVQNGPIKIAGAEQSLREARVGYDLLRILDRAGGLQPHRLAGLGRAMDQQLNTVQDGEVKDMRLAAVEAYLSRHFTYYGDLKQQDPQGMNTVIERVNDLAYSANRILPLRSVGSRLKYLSHRIGDMLVSKRSSTDSA